MKFFTKFCVFFSLFASSALSFGYFVLGFINLADYFDAEYKIEKSMYLSACGSDFSTGILILIVGFALASIIYLIRNATYKNEINDEKNSEN